MLLSKFGSEVSNKDTMPADNSQKIFFLIKNWLIPLSPLRITSWFCILLIQVFLIFSGMPRVTISMKTQFICIVLFTNLLSNKNWEEIL